MALSQWGMPSFNSTSRRLIQNIYNNARSHPTYMSYEITLDNATYFSQGGIAIVIEKNGVTINMFLFFPSFNGKIGSVAIYGKFLAGHKQAIERSGLLFDLPVSDIEVVHGLEDFLNVTLKDYSI